MTLDCAALLALLAAFAWCSTGSTIALGPAPRGPFVPDNRPEPANAAFFENRPDL
jgi:hypothetical protein